MKVGDPMNEDTTVGATIRYYPYVKVIGCLSVCDKKNLEKTSKSIFYLYF